MKELNHPQLSSLSADGFVRVIEQGSGGAFPALISVANLNGRGALVYATGAQSISNNTVTLVEFNTESRDTDGFFNSATSATRFVIPANVSLIRLTAVVRMENSTTGFRQLQFLKNGSTMTPTTVTKQQAAGLNIINLVSHPIEVAEDDYFEVEAFQNSGGSLTIQPGSTFVVSFGIEVLA